MAHHPGTAVNALGLDLSDIPHALTTHLMSYNSNQFQRATQSAFLSQAAQGKLPKSTIAQWLADDRVYLQGSLSLHDHLLRLIRSSMPQEATSSKEEKSIEHRLIDWLELSTKNLHREEDWFVEIDKTHKLNISWIDSTKNGTVRSEGVQRFETLFAQTNRTKHTFIPWLEGAVLLWATEKVYYEAWSWARKQDAQQSPKNYSKDADGGLMRRELIPNWANRDFLMFVETLERIVNEGVGNAVNRDGTRWKEVKERAYAVWETLLAAEEAFWPTVNESTNKAPVLNGVEIRALNFVRMQGGELLGQGTMYDDGSY